MADTRHVSAYGSIERHRRDQDRLRQARRRKLLLAAVPMAPAVAFGFWLLPPLGFVIAFVCCLVLFFLAIDGGSSVPAHELIGASGEQAVLNELGKLSDDHVVFNRLMLPDDTLPGGRRELDFVVVGPSGVDIIEVKNSPGRIHVAPDKRQWPVLQRAGCGSRPVWRTLPNPLLQIRPQIAALETWLMRHSLAVPVQGVVCFSRPGAVVDNAEAAELPVITLDQVNATMTTKAATMIDPEQRRRIVAELASLKRPAGRRRPVSAAA